jgi:hypothetical protein
MSKRKNEEGVGVADEGDEIGLLNRMRRLLEILVRLNLESMRGDRSQNEMISMLDSVGCGQSEIADLLGTTANTVNVSLYKAKKRKKKK